MSSLVVTLLEHFFYDLGNHSVYPMSCMCVCVFVTLVY